MGGNVSSVTNSGGPATAICVKNNCQFTTIGSNFGGQSTWDGAAIAQNKLGLPSFVAIPVASNVATFATGGAASSSGYLVLSHLSSTTINMTGLVNGSHFQIELNQDSTGSNTITPGSGCVNGWLVKGASGYVLTTTAISLTAPPSGTNLLIGDYDGAYQSACLISIE